MEKARFAKGQRVRSLVTSQGLTEGTVYTIVDMMCFPGMFGTFVHYALQETPSHAAVVMRNGHLLLTEA